MIASFKDKETQHLFETGEHRKLGDTVHATTKLESLRIPAGNRLETLRGDRAGQFSIRVNDRWRICFTWEDGNAYDVEVVDYH